VDTNEHIRNRSLFPPSELEKYAGKYVAWNPDGTQIIASDADPIKLTEAVKASSYDATEVVLSFVPLSDNGMLGGGTLTGESA
jgi:hypothetical protein